MDKKYNDDLERALDLSQVTHIYYNGVLIKKGEKNVSK